jgi:hypothetical protein
VSKSKRKPPRFICVGEGSVGEIVPYLEFRQAMVSTRPDRPRFLRFRTATTRSRRIGRPVSVPAGIIFQPFARGSIVGDALTPIHAMDIAVDLPITSGKFPDYY